MNEKSKFSDLKTRCITAVFLIGFIIGCEYISTHYAEMRGLFPLVALGMVLICAYEYRGLTVTRDFHSLDRWSGFLAAGVAPILVGAHLVIFPSIDLKTGIPLVLSASIVGLFSALLCLAYAGRVSIEVAKTVALKGLMGGVIGAGGASLVHLASFENHSLLFWLIIVVAANDTGAYFSGILFGKTKLSPALSPGKTIAGTIGGLLCGLIAGVLLHSFTPFSTVSAGLFALCAAFVSQLFDLAKSFIKRIAQVKDSGTLLPGHGGFLDRLDGILGASLAIHVMAIVMVLQ